jgi:hypothetical protein
MLIWVLVVLAMLITQWLTMRSAEEEESQSRRPSSDYGDFESPSARYLGRSSYITMRVNDKPVPISRIVSGWDHDDMYFSLR